MKKSRYILIFLFVLLLWIPVACMSLHCPAPTYLNEKRTLAKFPHLDLDTYATFPTLFEGYFNDNFYARDLLIHWNSYIRYAFNISVSKDVIIGKNNRLFLANESLEDSAHNRPFSEQEVNKIVTNLTYNVLRMGEKNYKLYILVAPNQGSIYPEDLPSYVTLKRPDSRLDQLKQAIAKYRAPIALVDPRKELIAAKKKYEVYYANDSHWNEIGAYIGYRELINAIHHDFPEIKPLDWNDFELSYNYTTKHDLSEMLGLAATIPSKTPHLRLKKSSMHDDPDSTPIAYFYGDSFSNALKPFLLYSLPKLTTKRDGPISPPYSEEPGIIIIEVVERNLNIFY